MKILREADPAAAGGGGGAAPPEPAPPTAAELAAGGKTPREIALEKRIAIVEDEKNTLSGQLKVLLKTAEEKDKKPAAAVTATQLLEETNEFLGWGLS